MKNNIIQFILTWSSNMDQITHYLESIGFKESNLNYIGTHMINGDNYIKLYLKSKKYKTQWLFSSDLDKLSNIKKVELITSIDDLKHKLLKYKLNEVLEINGK